MQPISKNNLNTSTTYNDITTTPIQETSRESTQAVAEYPLLNSRTITSVSSNQQPEFPSELLYLKCSELSITDLPFKTVESWGKAVAESKNLQNIAENIFTNKNLKEPINHFFNIMNNLNYDGSVKDLYNAFNLVSLNKQAEELLDAAMKQAETTGKIIVKQSTKTTSTTNINSPQVNVATAINNQPEDSIFLNKWFPAPEDSIYKNFHNLLSIDSCLATHWQAVAKAYNILDADINKIRSEAKNTNKLYSEVLINRIIKLYAYKNTETILLDFYNILKKVNYSLSQELKHWVEDISVNFDKTTTSEQHDVAQYNPQSLNYTSKPAIPQPILKQVTSNKPPQVSQGSNIQVTDNKSVESILMNKWFPQPGDSIYKHFHDMLGMSSSLKGEYWKCLLGNYGMTNDDCKTVIVESMYKGQSCSEVAIELILEKQQTIDETTVLLDFYKKLKLVHSSLARQLLEWAKTQPINPQLSKVKINQSSINYYDNLKRKELYINTNNQSAESILKNKKLPQKGDAIYNFFHREVSKLYYNTCVSEESSNFYQVLKSYNIKTVNDIKLFATEVMNKKVLPSELLVTKIEETTNKETMLLDFYNNIKKIDGRFANVLLIWAKNQPVAY
jgi:antitoxin component of RelBE/YafQ-DinJ toxin-antitoxin module